MANFKVLQKGLPVAVRSIGAVVDDGIQGSMMGMSPSEQLRRSNQPEEMVIIVGVDARQEGVDKFLAVASEDPVVVSVEEDPA